MRKFSYFKLAITITSVILISCVCLVFSAFSEGQAPILSQTIGIVVSPLQKATSSVGNFFSNIHGYFVGVSKIYSENEQLRKTVASLEDELRARQADALENKQLRELLGLKQKHESFEFEIAEIIAVSGGDWDMTFTVDKGAVNGISVNDCVITSQGMVGYVSSVGATFSYVTAITDPQTAIGILVSRSRESAVAEGSFDLMYEGKLKLSYLKKDADVISGDTVETSGLGGIFPKGILVGTIESINVENHGISNYAVVRPAVDLTSVKKVFIIKSFEVEE